MKRIAAVLFGIWLGLSLWASGAPAVENGGPIDQLESLRSDWVLGQPRTHEDLTIYPVTVAKVEDTTRYLSLDTALRKRRLRVTEWGSGQVPRLKVTNRGKQRIFIMAGEIVTGAKQDRMSAHDVLFGPTADPLALPVYCVEEGRWVRSSQSFAAGGTAGTKKLRRSAVKKFSQGKVWRDVAEKSRQAGVHSSTGTMQAVYANPRLRREIEKYVKAFEDMPDKVTNMVGYVAVVRGQVSSADIFVNPDLLRDLWKKLIKATAVDVVTQKPGHATGTSLETIKVFLQAGFDGQFKRIANPGLGEEYLIEGRDGVSGSTLVAGTSVIHLALFSAEKGDRPRELRPDLRHVKGSQPREFGKGKFRVRNPEPGEEATDHPAPRGTKTWKQKKWRKGRSK